MYYFICYFIYCFIYYFIKDFYYLINDLNIFLLNPNFIVLFLKVNSIMDLRYLYYLYYLLLLYFLKIFRLYFKNCLLLFKLFYSMNYYYILQLCLINF